MVLSHHKFIILKITFHRLKSSKWSYIFSYDSKISRSVISPPSSSEKFKQGEAVKLLVANTYFLIFSFSLQSLSFIIGNGYRQLLVLKWQAHFLHFPGNVWKNHGLSAGSLSCKDCSVREATGQLICTSTSPETITVLGNAAKELNVHFPFHPPECLKDTYSRAEILITLDNFNSFVTIIHKWDRLFFFSLRVWQPYTTSFICTKTPADFTHKIATWGRNNDFENSVTSQDLWKGPRSRWTTFETCWTKTLHKQTKVHRASSPDNKGKLIIAQKSFAGTKVQKREEWFREDLKRNSRMRRDDI